MKVPLLHPQQPLRRKLPVLISLLLCAVVAALSWLAFVQLQHALLGAAEQRVIGAADQVAGMLRESVLRVRRGAFRLARTDAVTNFLTHPGAATRAGAVAALGRDFASTPQLAARTLWSRDGVPLLRVGAPEFNGPTLADLLSQERRGHTAASEWRAGALRLVADSVFYDIVVPSFGAHGDVVGFLVETRRLRGQGAQLIESLIGSDAKFLLGNAVGGLWTDLTVRAPGPVYPERVGTAFTYSRQDTARIGAMHAVLGAPWLVSIEIPRRAALAPSHRFLLRAGLIALLVVLIGALAASILSRSITEPLDAVMRAAEGMAAGDYGQRLPVRGHHELGRLAVSFNVMAERVAAASRVLERQAEEAQASAQQLEAANQELALALADAERSREAAVRAAREREETLAQLQQAQRMEAVGQLAGGVAHDFNNLLTVITSYSTMLLSDLPESSAHAEDVREIQQAASRASALTRQLLAFSRRQMLQPRVLDLNALTANLEKMLRRLLREDIQLETRLAPELGYVSADPGQLEQIIINLAVNARDAMPDGGRLTIETARVQHDPARSPGPACAPPGTYVTLTVTDTGHGMDEDTKRHIFDPFFTTKPVGHGTGLGLATVYGIVKQSDGHITVTSERGHGAAFQIYLPAVAADGQALATAEHIAPCQGGPERILLVEDEPNVRRIARRMLERGGYTVIEAANGAEALRLVESRREPIALVLTDLVMPEMGGRELATRLQAVSPTSRVLFMSGYSEDVVLRQQVAAEEALLLEKPFTLETLTRKVREALTAA
ncbi:MAG TPA: ATP-binding protein [Gemmatimonadaceae bacterium]|nr:ATP-binding protein [Gemmatimonadaceae bacterium]